MTGRHIPAADLAIRAVASSRMSVLVAKFRRA